MVVNTFLRSDNMIGLVGFETVRNVFLSNSRCKRRTIRKRLKGQKKMGWKVLVNFVKLAKIAISPVLGKGLKPSQFRVGPTMWEFR
jgi:hypothetical protein